MKVLPTYCTTSKLECRNSRKLEHKISTLHLTLQIKRNISNCGLKSRGGMRERHNSRISAQYPLHSSRLNTEVSYHVFGGGKVYLDKHNRLSLQFCPLLSVRSISPIPKLEQYPLLSRRTSRTTTIASLLKHGGRPFSDMNSYDDGLYLTRAI